jgi:arylsulfatase A-like enzyme
MSTPAQPNIVFLHVDQWRGDCLSIDGHPVVHTPYLDKMALNGVRFSKAYVSCPTCIPSRATFMTGLSPAHTGRVGYRDGVPWNYPVTLPGEFTRHGYRTHAIGKLHADPARNRLGFESVELHDGYLHFNRDRVKNPDLRDDDYIAWLRRETGRPDADYFEHGVHCNSIVARPWLMAEYLHPTNWVVSRGIDFLSRHQGDRPFFLYLSFHRPHPPYDPPAWALEQYLNAPMPPPPVGNWAEIFAAHDSCSPEAVRARYRPDVLQRARAGYYGHITHIDHQISRFLELLIEFRLHTNTWIVFTSDHGELMGDHHLFRKSAAYEGSARVPLIVQPPPGVKLARSAVRDTVVEMRDFLPTLLDCAGLPAPEGLDGRSFLPHIMGQSSEPLRPWLHGEHLYFGYSMQWLTDGREKYIWHSGDGREQLFDLQIDPQELNDLAFDAPSEPVKKRLAYWRRALVSELQGREEGFVDDAGNLVPGRPVNPVLKHLRESTGC